MKILLVDDSRTIRSIQKNVLKQLGHTDIMEAEDGVQALAAFKETVPDLLLVDWNMPNMDGITLVRKIREINKTVPMMLCTTEAEKPSVLEAMMPDGNNYSCKPLTEDAPGATTTAATAARGRPSSCRRGAAARRRRRRTGKWRAWGRRATSGMSP